MKLLLLFAIPIFGCLAFYFGVIKGQQLAYGMEFKMCVQNVQHLREKQQEETPLYRYSVAKMYELGLKVPRSWISKDLDLGDPGAKLDRELHLSKDGIKAHGLYLQFIERLKEKE